MASCPAASNPKSIWPPFCPNVGAAYLYAALFAIVLCAHVTQMFVHRKVYCWVIAFSALMQTATYILRVLSIQNVTSLILYTDWFVLMMVAPIWTNAFAYMVMGRMLYNFTPSASVFKIKAWRLGMIFVLLDIVAFLIQVYGAVVASSSPNTAKGLKQALNGVHIYMGGIGFQQLCILLFLAISIRLHKKLREQAPSADRSRGLVLLYIEYAAVGLITVRIIFRLVEYSNGFDGVIPTHEAYQYVFDSTMMLIALILFNVFHPGRLMPGKESNLPGRKVRKAWKAQGVKPHGRVGDDQENGGDHLLSTFRAPEPREMRAIYDTTDTISGRYAKVSPSDQLDEVSFERPSEARNWSSLGHGCADSSYVRAAERPGTNFF